MVIATYVMNTPQVLATVVNLEDISKDQLLAENKELKERLVKLESARMSLKLAEAALKESEERLRSQYEAFPVATYTWAKKGREFVLVDMNRQARSESGSSPDSFLQQTASQIFHDRVDILERIIFSYEKKTVVRYETEYQSRATGEPYYAIFTLYHCPPNLLIMHSENITERKRAENALRESEERYRQLAECSNQVFWFVATNPEKILYVSPAYEKIWNMPVQALYEEPTLWRRDIHPDDLAQVEKTWKDCLLGKRKEFLAEFRLLVGHQVRWVMSSGITLLNEDGRVYRISGIARDITERRTAVEKLRQSELFFRTIADFTYDWEYWQGPDGKFIYVSPSCERISGYKPDEFLENPRLLEEIIHPSDRTAFKKHAARSLQPGHPHRLDFRIIRKDGEVRTISQYCQAVMHPERGFLGVRASNREREEKFEDSPEV